MPDAYKVSATFVSPDADYNGQLNHSSHLRVS